MKNFCFYSAIACAEKSIHIRYYYVSADDQADALQDSVLRFLEKAHSIGTMTLDYNAPSFLTDEDECMRWLSRVAERSIIDKWRNRRNISKLSIDSQIDRDDIEPLMENICSYYPHVEISYDCIIALQSLKKPMRECFELHIEGWAFYEIANQLNISEKCAQKRFQRAKERLRKTLATYKHS